MDLGSVWHLEPAVITGLIAALLGVLISFGVPITPEQKTHLLELATVAVPLIMALVIRRKVTPNKQLEDAGLNPATVKADAEVARSA